MRSKVIFLCGAAAGYVLGSRAGRARYEQIKSKSQELWQSEPVQAKVSDAGGAIKAAAPVVTEKVAEAAKQAGGAAKNKLTSDDEPDHAADVAATSTANSRSGTASS